MTQDPSGPPSAREMDVMERLLRVELRQYAEEVDALATDNTNLRAEVARLTERLGESERRFEHLRRIWWEFLPDEDTHEALRNFAATISETFDRSLERKP